MPDNAAIFSTNATTDAATQRPALWTAQFPAQQFANLSAECPAFISTLCSTYRTTDPTTKCSAHGATVTATILAAKYSTYLPTIHATIHATHCATKLPTITTTKCAA